MFSFATADGGRPRKNNAVLGEWATLPADMSAADFGNAKKLEIPNGTVEVLCVLRSTVPYQT